IEVGGLVLLLLDSSVPGKDYGELDAQTLHWLTSQLTAAAHQPTLLFLHHPPFATGIAHMDRQNLRNATHLAAVVQRHPQVRLIAAGHVHRAVTTLFAGISASICPAPNHAVDLDLAAERPPSLRIEPRAFHVDAWFAGGRFGTLVTHLVPIGDFPGPHPFFDADGRCCESTRRLVARPRSRRAAPAPRSRARRTPGRPISRQCVRRCSAAAGAAVGARRRTSAVGAAPGSPHPSR